MSKVGVEELVVGTSVSSAPESKSNSKSVQKKGDHSKENIDDLNPVILMTYDFFTEPDSSRMALAWSILVSLVVGIRLVFIGLETCDGPNQYGGRLNMARFHFLLTKPQYNVAYIVLSLPLVIDAFGRLFMLGILSLNAENKKLLYKIYHDKFSFVLYIFDILSIFPFFVRVASQRGEGDFGDVIRMVLRLIELLATSRIFRLSKDIPAFWAIRIALFRSIPNLVVPLFFFFAFNMSGGLILYFLEPCYNSTTCYWKNLADATFYSIVSMTTTGYGNQVPTYILGRLIGCVIMIFGSLYLSMPLAVIGNEYQRAWDDVTVRLQKKAQLRAMKAQNAAGSLIRMRANRGITQIAPSNADGPSINGHSFPGIEVAMVSAQGLAVETEEEKALVKESPIMEAYQQLDISIKNLRQAIKDNSQAYMNPMILMHFCQVKSATATLAFQLGVGLNFMSCFDNPDDPGNINHALRMEALMKNGGLSPIVDAGVAVLNAAAVKRNSIVPESSTGKGQNRLSISGRFSELASLKNSLEKFRSLNSNNMSLTSMKSRFNNIMGFSSDEARMRSNSTEFQVMMSRSMSNPQAIRSRIWMMLEAPRSSREARALQLFLLFLICASIFVLYTETMITLGSYGEQAKICGSTLRYYCEDKFNVTVDPGCFVFGSTPTSYKPLRFECDDADCFGMGQNFGSLNQNMTCGAEVAPFQDYQSISLAYDLPYFYSVRPAIHRMLPICTRLECQDSQQVFDGNRLWIPVEIFMNVIFTIELFLRISVSSSVLGFFRDKMNMFDILSVAPFYAELFNAGLSDGVSSIDFAILASSPEKLFIIAMRSFKIFRVFKLTRHFRASKELGETAAKVWRQILGMIALLVFLVIIFAIMLYEVESGKRCFVGDPACVDIDNAVSNYRDGRLIKINKIGKISQFSNMFYSLWFSVVTLTTTGYGDINVVTNVGQIMAIFLMCAGTFYMAMPLTAAANTFYDVHQKYCRADSRSQKNKTIEGAVKARLITNQVQLYKKNEEELNEFIGELMKPPDITNTGLCNEDTHDTNIGRLQEDMSSYTDSQRLNGNGMDSPRKSMTKKMESKLMHKCTRLVDSIKLSMPPSSDVKALAIAYGSKQRLFRLQLQQLSATIEDAKQS